ncbi:MAG: cation transporter [Chitinophagales bacterium]|nr:cation transporter [Chitinophagales bacterium]
MKNWILAIVSVMLVSILTFAAEPQKATVNLKISGMKCMGCEKKVKSVLKDTKGVLSTESVDAASGTAVIVIDKNLTSEKEVSTTLAEKTGYKVSTNNSGGKNNSSKAKHSCCSGKASTSCEKK